MFSFDSCHTPLVSAPVEPHMGAPAPAAVRSTLSSIVSLPVRTSPWAGLPATEAVKLSFACTAPLSMAISGATFS